MAFSVSNTFSNGDTIEAAELNENFTDVETVLNGGIGNDNISSSAAISTSKLAADEYEITLQTRLYATELNAAVSAFWLVGSIPADANETYTVTALETQTYAGGARTAAVYTLEYGNVTSGFSTIKAGITTGTGSSTFTANRLTSLTNTACSVSTSTQNYFRLDVTTQGASWATTDHFVLTIKLKRALK